MKELFLDQISDLYKFVSRFSFTFCVFESFNTMRHTNIQKTQNPLLGEIDVKFKANSVYRHIMMVMIKLKKNFQMTSVFCFVFHWRNPITSWQLCYWRLNEIDICWLLLIVSLFLHFHAVLFCFVLFKLAFLCLCAMFEWSLIVELIEHSICFFTLDWCWSSDVIMKWKKS